MAYLFQKQLLEIECGLKAGFSIFPSRAPVPIFNFVVTKLCGITLSIIEKTEAIIIGAGVVGLAISAQLEKNVKI